MENMHEYIISRHLMNNHLRSRSSDLFIIVLYVDYHFHGGNKNVKELLQIIPVNVIAFNAQATRLSSDVT